MIIKSAGSKFDNSILPKIRQILLHCSYELTEKKVFCWLNEQIYKNELLSV